MTRPASGARRPSSRTRRRSTYQSARWPEERTKSPRTTAFALIAGSRSVRSLTVSPARLRGALWRRLPSSLVPRSSVQATPRPSSSLTVSPARLRGALWRRLPSSLVPRSSVQATPRPSSSLIARDPKGWSAGAGPSPPQTGESAPAGSVGQFVHQAQRLGEQPGQPGHADLGAERGLEAPAQPGVPERQVAVRADQRDGRPGPGSPGQRERFAAGKGGPEVMPDQ